MEIHHDRHHKAYVDNANAALAGTAWENSSVEDVLTSLGQIPEDIRGAVRNNAGGHYNHSLFWEMMSPEGGGTPSGDLGAAIDAAFGSFDEFKEKFKAGGIGQFGSGWVWLVHDGSGLAVVSTPNQDSPLTDGKTPGVESADRQVVVSDAALELWGRLALAIGRDAACPGYFAEFLHRCAAAPDGMAALPDPAEIPSKKPRKPVADDRNQQLTAFNQLAATWVATSVPYSMRARMAGGTSSEVIETLVTPGLESLWMIC
jgi:superoxide dismutase